MLIEMTIKGLVVDSFSSTPIVILKDKAGDKVLSIWVGIYEANAIALHGARIEEPALLLYDCFVGTAEPLPPLTDVHSRRWDLRAG